MAAFPKTLVLRFPGVSPVLAGASSLLLAATPAPLDASREAPDGVTSVSPDAGPRDAGPRAHGPGDHGPSALNPAAADQRLASRWLARLVDGTAAEPGSLSSRILKPGNVASRGLAVAPSGLADTDCDLIPDRLEQVVLSDPMSADSDLDGWSDLEEFLAPGGTPSAIPVHQIRFAVHSESTPGGPVLWMNCFFHVIGQSLSPVLESMDISLLTESGMSVSMLSLLLSSELDVATTFDADRGRFVRVSFPFLPESDAGFLLPSVVSLRATMAGTSKRSGVFLETLGGGVTTTVPLSAEEVTQQPTDPTRKGNGFWQQSRMCVLKLAAIGTAPGATLAEVIASDCIVTDTTAACPESCAQALGRLILIPDILATITGG